MSKENKNMPVAKEKSSDLATYEDIEKAFGGHTGSDYEKSSASFPYLLIMHAQTNDETFVDSGKPDASDYGKLWIRSEANHRSEMKNQVSGTLIKEQKGAEYWVDGKQVFAANRFISEDEKYDLIEEYPPVTNRDKPNNIIKIVLKLDTPFELNNGESHEFVLMTIKGGSFMPYNQGVKDKQAKLFAESNQLQKMVNVNRVPVTFWNLKVGVKQDVNDSGNKYYRYAFDISENDPSTAIANSQHVKELIDFDLITMRPYADKNNAKSESNTAEEAEVVDNSEIVEEKFENTEDGVIDVNNLPF